MVSLIADVSEPVHKALVKHLKETKGADQHIFITGAIASFLLENGCTEPGVMAAYLEAVKSHE